MQKPNPRSPRIRLIPVILIGFYAWATSIYPLLDLPVPISATSSFNISKLCGWTALLSLLSSGAVPQRFSMYFSLHGFIAGCLLCWATAIDSETGRSMSLYGSLAWLAYTVAVGGLSIPDRAAPNVERQAGTYLPRVRPSRAAVLSVVVAVVLALCLLALAFDMKRPELAVLALLCALSVGLLVLNGGLQLAIFFQQPQSSAVFVRNRFQIFSLSLVLVALIAAGLATDWAAG